MCETTPPAAEPRRFYHGRVVAMAVGLFLVAVAAVDFAYERRLTWWTVGKALGGAALALVYFYLVRYPKIKRGKP